MFNPEFVAALLLFSIPIIAIVGGITVGIVKSIGRQRLVEMAQRERIVAIERGIDPATLPPLPGLGADADDPYLSRYEHDRRRSQGLMIGGIITTAGGVGLMLFLMLIVGGTDPDSDPVWAVAIIPTFVGLALLISAFLVRPRTTNGSH